MREVGRVVGPEPRLDDREPSEAYRNGKNQSNQKILKGEKIFHWVTPVELR